MLRACQAKRPERAPRVHKIIPHITHTTINTKSFPVLEDFFVSSSSLLSSDILTGSGTKLTTGGEGRCGGSLGTKGVSGRWGKLEDGENIGAGFDGEGGRET